MTEIVRMTTQQQPLEVGIPLYPFSHAGVFTKGDGENDGQQELEHVAPLPVTDSYADDVDHPLGASQNVLGA